MVGPIGAAAAGALGASSGAKRAVEKSFKVKSRRWVVVSLFGTAAIVIVAKARRGELDDLPRIVIGGAFAFFVIGIVAEVNTDLGNALAILIMLTAIFENGPDVFGAVGEGTKRGKKKTKKATGINAAEQRAIGR